MRTPRRRGVGGNDTGVSRLDNACKRTFDVVIALLALLLLLPLLLTVALAVKLDGPGPVFFRARRVGSKGRPFAMLKFRKMVDGAVGAPLTTASDQRFTTVGKVLAKMKFDELPQLWNVVKGEMSIVGPRPEDPQFVRLHPEDYTEILRVPPGITGLSQLAFAKEPALLDRADTMDYYVGRLLPAKVEMDVFYARHRSFARDLSIFGWTFLAVLLSCDVAVHRETGRLSLRRRPSSDALEPVETVQ
jgi:lipopolysaccharide/colanic/teichoic acid biosynthesis glycosyltransferase